MQKHGSKTHNSRNIRPTMMPMRHHAKVGKDVELSHNAGLAKMDTKPKTHARNKRRQCACACADTPDFFSIKTHSIFSRPGLGRDACQLFVATKHAGILGHDACRYSWPTHTQIRPDQDKHDIFLEQDACQLLNQDTCQIFYQDNCQRLDQDACQLPDQDACQFLSQSTCKFLDLQISRSRRIPIA